MDNYFFSIKLFKYLCEKKIGACGTVRKNSANFPQILKVDKKLEWDTLSDVVVDDVLAVLWMDNGPVTMLSIIHQINGDENQIERIRRRSQETSTNATKVRAIFGNASKKSLPIPIVIDDYNHFMGGVDIADQLRGYYNTQLSVRRTWMPLFFWLLDTAIVNSYLILKKSGENIEHKEFRLQLVWDLIKEGLEEEEKQHTRSYVDELTNKFEFIQVEPPKRYQYVTSDFELSLERLSSGGHFPV
jgi:hypothetical protein